MSTEPNRPRAPRPSPIAPRPRLCRAAPGPARLASAWLATLLLPLAASAGYPDWQALAEVAVIEVLTQDADGSPRESKVWFVLLDGEAYLRTSDSRWLANLRRDPDLALRIEGRTYEARAEEIAGDEILARVDAASVEKYGWQERVIHVFRMRKPEILRLLPRAAEPG